MSGGEIECRYSGKEVAIIVTNNSGRYCEYRYECVWLLGNGIKESLSGSIGVSAGDSQEVASATYGSEVADVYGKSLVPE